jgi:hypothetical protein
VFVKIIPASPGITKAAKPLAIRAVDETALTGMIPMLFSQSFIVSFGARESRQLEKLSW